MGSSTLSATEAPPRPKTLLEEDLERAIRSLRSASWDLRDAADRADEAIEKIDPEVLGRSHDCSAAALARHVLDLHEAAHQDPKNAAYSPLAQYCTLACQLAWDISR